MKWSKQEELLVFAFVLLQREKHLSIYGTVKHLEFYLHNRTYNSIYSKFQRLRRA